VFIPLLVAAVSMTWVAGCAEIPTAGPVERGDQIQGTDDDPPVRVLPRGPIPGQSPVEVVKGFIDASASFENDHEVARKFLTPRADATWNPETGVTVIDDNPRRTLKADGGQVTLFAEQTASITSGGAFIPRGGVPITRSFHLKKEGDSWQISKVPQGLILDRIEVSLSYRAFDIFFMNPENSFLVPDPVYLPVEQSGSATSLVQALLDGPTSWLRPAVETLIPADTELVVESVPVENGIAKVDLSAEFLDAPPATLELAAAQITSTLLELSSSVTGVEISVEGSPLQLPPEPSVFTADTWDRYETDALTPALGPIFVRDGAVRRLQDGKPVPVQGALGRGGHDVREPSQSWDGSTVTALNQSASRLLLTHPFVSAGVAHVENGRHLLPATIDGDGRVWSLDVGGKRPQLRVLDGNHWKTAELQAPSGDIRSFRVSADGTRMAMVLRPDGEGVGSGQLLVGRVVQGADRLRVEAFRRIELSLSKVRHASWVDSTTLAVIGTSSGQAVGPLLININRTVTPLSTDALAHFTTVVGAPGLPLMADASQHEIWESNGTGWNKLTRGSDPAYPG
jgi:hypothetical protein